MVPLGIMYGNKCIMFAMKRDELRNEGATYLWLEGDEVRRGLLI